MGRVSANDADFLILGKKVFGDYVSGVAACSKNNVHSGPPEIDWMRPNWMRKGWSWVHGGWQSSSAIELLPKSKKTWGGGWPSLLRCVLPQIRMPLLCGGFQRAVFL